MTIGTITTVLNLIILVGVSVISVITKKNPGDYIGKLSTQFSYIGNLAESFMHLINANNELSGEQKMSYVVERVLDTLAKQNVNDVSADMIQGIAQNIYDEKLKASNDLKKKLDKANTEE